jgi:hypothetical protein
MSRLRAVLLVLASASIGGLVGPPAALASTSSAPAPTLVAIRAAHHPGFDRLVFEFSGGLPKEYGTRYVSQVIADGSGKVMHIPGSAFLRVRFFAANGHDSNGNRSYGPAARSYALPGMIRVSNAGDFEAVLSFGVGVAKREPFHTFTLANPSRYVIDLRTPYKTTAVRDYLLNSHNYATGHRPYLQAVSRPVITPAVAFGALQRLWAGPTQKELAQGLRFVASRTTGFSKVTISDHVARVYLTGGCNSGGSTFTIANEIFPTLKQFSSIRWVKIYSPWGHTEHPTGHSDSIPVCLEP